MARDGLLIVGAGPAGLALASKYPGAARILEAADEVGGLCRSIEFGDGVFDLGGHSFHTPYAEVSQFVERLMGGRWHSQRRDARVSMNGELIDYPFQTHFMQLSNAALVAECREYLPPSGRPSTASDFEEWIVERFGAGIARHFMLPYNRKLWARDLKRIACDWVGERIAETYSKGAQTAERGRQPLQSDSWVSYPADGGFVEIYRAMANLCGPIELSSEVCEIDPINKIARTGDGRTWPWTRLASTMPLPGLVRALDGCPADLIADVDRLEFVSLKVLLILIGAPLAAQPQRIYLPDPAVPPHKVAFNHTSSPALRSRPAHAIMGEISYSEEKPARSDADLQSATLDWLIDSRLVRSAADVAEFRVEDIRFAYPVYTHDRPAILARIRAYLEPFGIYSFGRFGGWDYVNSDACIWQGWNLASRLAAEGT